MKLRIVPFVFLLLALSCSREAETIQKEQPAAMEQPSLTSGTTPGVIRVKFKHEPEEGATFTLGSYTLTRTFPPAGKWEKRHRAAGLHLWYDVIFDETVPVTKAGEAIASAFEDIEIVEYIPEAKTREMAYPFNDPRLPEQWHYQNPGGKDQWAEGCDVNAFRAWTIETGNPEVIVAVNDIGVDYMHEDLHANMWVNEAELNGLPGEDDDNNGYADDVYGYSFMTTDGKVAIGKIEPGDHGTHVAGTIAAVNNNGIGVGGVAGGNGTPGSGVRLMVTQTLDGRNGALTPASFVYAADNGAVLINCSWGFTNNEQETPKSYVEAIDYFNTYAGLDENGVQTGPMAGGLIIFAAGNDGREIEHPAMDDNVFAVAALSANYVRSYFTSFGEWVDICAPGGDANRKTYILSTLPDNKYGNMQGSSMAAPHVTGVAALIVSYYGAGKKGFTRDKLIHLLQSTANKKALEENGSYATRLGAGLVDAYAALTAGDDQVPMPVSVLNGTANANAINLEWTVPGSDGLNPPYKFTIFYGPATLQDLNPEQLPEGVQQIEVLTYGRKAGESMSQVFNGLDFDTDYHFRIRSESLTGLVSELSKEIIIRTGHNNPPVITPLDGTTATIRSFETGTLRFRLEDADGHTLTPEVTQIKGLTVTRSDDGLLTLSLSGLSSGPGQFDGTIRVSDGYVTAEQGFAFIVQPNTAPVVTSAIADQIFNGLSESRTIDLGEFFSDADGETLTYKAESSTASIIVKTSIEGSKLTLVSNSFGMNSITVTATDGSGASASQSFRVLVRDGSTPVEAYPNPVKDYLNIRTSELGAASVKLINSLGGSVFNAQIQTSPFDPVPIDCRSFPAGVYTLMVTFNGDTVVKTIVKQ